MRLNIPATGPDGQWRWAWVANLAITNGWKHGAELGVKRGHFSAYLVDHVSDLSMLAVDTWSPEGISPRYAHYRHENNYTKCLELFEGRAIAIMRMTTHQAARHVPDKSLDFAFIDASHEFAAVQQDIDDWLPKVTSALLGHDYHDSQVYKAVHSRFNTVIEGPDNCWMVQI